MKQRTLPPERPRAGAARVRELLPQWAPLLLATLARGAALVALVLFARLVVRPALGALDNARARSGSPRASRSSRREMAGALPGAGAQAPVPEQAGQASNLRTEEGVRTLRNWLNQG